MAVEDHADALADVLGSIQRLIRRRLRRTMAEPRTRGAEIELLRLVVVRPGIRVSEAARELYLAGNSVSTLVHRLSRVGWLARGTDPEDRRSTRLHPTPAGVSRLRDWQEQRSTIVRGQLARLSEADRAALSDALPALHRLAGNLHEEAEGS